MEKLWRCPIRGGNWFLSVSSARRVTRGGDLDRLGVVISIHALREEGDDVLSHCPLADLAISIHALREEGDLLAQICKHRIIISIHALREEGDLIQHGQDLAQLIISIHALREEGDSKNRDKISIFL